MGIIMAALGSIVIIAGLLLNLSIPVLIFWGIYKLINRSSKKSSSTVSSTQDAKPKTPSVPAQKPSVSSVPASKPRIASAPVSEPSAVPVQTSKKITAASILEDSVLLSKIPHYSQEDIKNLSYEKARFYVSTDNFMETAYKVAFAKAGHPDAFFDLAIDYISGNEIVEEDINKAEVLLLEAYNRKNLKAATILALINFTKAENALLESDDTYDSKEKRIAQINALFARGGQYFAEALAIYDPEAVDIYCEGFSALCQEDDSVNFPLNSVNRALPKTIEALHSENTGRSNYVLGMFYLKGIGVEPDVFQAKSYLETAAALGSSDAQEELQNPIFDD